MSAGLWKVFSLVPVFENVHEQKTATMLVFFLWLVILINNRLVDHLQKSGFFSDFQHGLARVSS